MAQLIHKWKFEPGDELKDSVGDWDLVQNGTVNYSLGKIGNDSVFDNSSADNNYLATADPKPIPKTGAIMEFIKPSTQISENIYPVGWHGAFVQTLYSGGINERLGMLIRNFGGASNRYYLKENGGFLDTTKYVHYTTCWDNENVYLYINGDLIQSWSRSDNPEEDKSTHHFSIGAGWANDYGMFSGNISDVRLYNGCPSPKEVKEISKGLVAKYNLRDLSDSSGNGNNLINESAVTFNKDGAIFDGGKGLKVDSNNYINLNGDVTITAEIKIMNNLGVRKCIVGKHYREFEFDAYIGGALHGYHYDSNEGSNYADYTVPSSIPTGWGDGEWHRVVWSLREDGHQVWATDGRLIDERKDGVNGTTASGNSLWIGSRYGSDLEFYAGDMIRNVNIYATAFDTNETVNASKIAASIDNKGNLHTKRLIETNSITIVKTPVIKDVVDSTYHSMGADFVNGEIDVSSFVEASKTLGNFAVIAEVILTSTTYYPTTFEYTRNNNHNGVVGYFKTVDDNWKIGYNKCYFLPRSYRDLDNTPWDDMTRLEVYRSGSSTIPTEDVGKYTITIKSVKLVKSDNNNTLSPIRPREDGIESFNFIEELGDGTIGLWDLGNGGIDKSGQGHNVKYNSNYEIVPTPYGNMVRLDDVDVLYKLLISNSTSYYTLGPGLSARTFMIMIKPEDVSKDNQYIWSCYNFRMVLHTTSTALTFGRMDSGSGPSYHIYGDVLIQNQYYVLTGIYRPDIINGNGQMEFYIDDVSQGVESIGSHQFYAGYTRSLEWGNANHGIAVPYVGLVGKSKIFNRELSPREIAGEVARLKNKQIMSTKIESFINGEIKEIN